LEDNVVCLGGISEEEKEELYLKCSIFVMPSYDNVNKKSVEGFGIVYIEANMYGKYVIGNNIGGVGDAIIDNVTGKLISSSDSKEISDAVISYFDILDSSSETELKNQSKKRIEWAKSHDMRVITREYYNCLKE
jgi:phosphatidylinositol alpha-1,6-mannosyltransferase